MKSANQIRLDTIHTLVGDQKFKEICTVLNRESVYFYDDLSVRNDEIRQAYFSGVSREALAVEYGLSGSSIDHIIAEKP